MPRVGPGRGRARRFNRRLAPSRVPVVKCDSSVLRGFCLFFWGGKDGVFFFGRASNIGVFFFERCGGVGILGDQIVGK